jgi:hypothetical protein
MTAYESSFVRSAIARKADMKCSVRVFLLMTTAVSEMHGVYGIFTWARLAHSGLMLAARITLAHFSRIVDQESSEVGWRQRQWDVSEAGDTCPNFWI